MPSKLSRLFDFKSWFTAPAQPAASGGPAFDIVYLPKSPKDAAFSSVVMSIVYWGARNLRQAPCKVYDGYGADSVPVEPHALADLWRDPQGLVNPAKRTNMSGGALMAALMYSQVLSGQWFLYKVRNASGQILGLDWLPPGSCKPEPMPDQPAVVDFYWVYTRTGRIRVEREDIVHGGWLVDPANPCEYMSPLTPIMRHVMADNQIAVYVQSITRSPATSKLIGPAGETPANFDPVLLKQLVMSSTTGENAGGPVVTNTAFSVQDLSMKPDDLAIEKLNRIPEERICSVLGVPPIVLQLGSGERAKFANMKEAREAAAEEFLVPFWESVASTLTAQLLPEFDKNKSRRVGFDTTQVRVLNEDEDARHKRAREDFQANLITREQALQAIGVQPAPGDDQIYAWMLKPAPMPPPGTPQGPDQGKAARALAEGM